MEERIKKILAEVNPDAADYDGDNLIEDLGIDSHDIFNIVMGIEEEFDIEVPPNQFKAINFMTIENIINMIENCEG